MYLLNKNKGARASLASKLSSLCGLHCSPTWGNSPSSPSRFWISSQTVTDLHNQVGDKVYLRLGLMFCYRDYLRQNSTSRPMIWLSFVGHLGCLGGGVSVPAACWSYLPLSWWPIIAKKDIQPNPICNAHCASRNLSYLASSWVRLRWLFRGFLATGYIYCQIYLAI